VVPRDEEPPLREAAAPAALAREAAERLAPEPGDAALDEPGPPEEAPAELLEEPPLDAEPPLDEPEFEPLDEPLDEPPEAPPVPPEPPDPPAEPPPEPEPPPPVGAVTPGTAGTGTSGALTVGTGTGAFTVGTGTGAWTVGTGTGTRTVGTGTGT
jgi:hypothetical protein